jgi:hypothetical protein
MKEWEVFSASFAFDRPILKLLTSDMASSSFGGNNKMLLTNDVNSRQKLPNE